jgi:hypothetical protein
MQLDIDTLEALRRQHPAWRLLAAESSALGANIYPRAALEYLNDWVANDKAWLRKFYPLGSDEPHFDITPATEKALAWLVTLSERQVVGTESRLLTLYELLRQMSDGSEIDAEARVRELQRKRAEIDAETYRDSDKRGGANGGRLALAPQKDWVVKRRAAPVVEKLRATMADFNAKQGAGKKISLADLIVLGGCGAIERAAHAAGIEATVPFTPGRVDTTQQLTDVEMFEWLKPVVDGFRNYTDDRFGQISQGVSPEEFFLDKAHLMKLSARNGRCSQAACGCSMRTTMDQTLASSRRRLAC